jgi:hypothetical protein
MPQHLENAKDIIGLEPPGLSGGFGISQIRTNELKERDEVVLHRVPDFCLKAVPSPPPGHVWQEALVKICQTLTVEAKSGRDEDVFAQRYSRIVGWNLDDNFGSRSVVPWRQQEILDPQELAIPDQLVTVGHLQSE